MRKEGNAIITKIIAGKIVQIVSTAWASIVLVWVSLVVNIAEIIYRTKELIKNTIINAWSWKFINSSIIGDVASCKPIWNGYAMEIYRSFACSLTLTRLCIIILISHWERHKGYEVGLKPILGGSIPSFLII